MQLIASFVLTVVLISPAFAQQFSIDSPLPGSVQSGTVAPPNGWICPRNGEITARIDGGPVIDFFEDLNRGDTAAPCGNSGDNAFGTLPWNWNLFGDGSHTIEFFDAGVEFAEVSFTIATFGVEFLPDEMVSDTVRNFPDRGTDVEVSWDGAIQNFRMTKVIEPQGNQDPLPGSCIVEPGDNIQDCINNVLDNGGGEVFLRAGTHMLSQYLHIFGSNLTVRGEGAATILSLANDAQTSNIAVGVIDEVNPDEVPGATPIRNIRIEDLSIDGNKDGQASEQWPAPRSYINVSGITIRFVENIIIRNVVVARARSAGILVEKSTERFLLERVELRESTFDGFSCSKSYDGIVVNSQLVQNTFAGITATCDCSDNIFSNNSIVGNGTGIQRAPGIYLAEAHRNRFTDNRLESNSDTGITLTGADCGVTPTGASLNYLVNNSMISHGSCGVFLDIVSANGGPGAGNKAIGTFYQGNEFDGVCNPNPTLYEEISPVVAP